MKRPEPEMILAEIDTVVAWQALSGQMARHDDKY